MEIAEESSGVSISGRGMVMKGRGSRGFGKFMGNGIEIFGRTNSKFVGVHSPLRFCSLERVNIDYVNGNRMVNVKKLTGKYPFGACNSLSAARLIVF